MSDTLKDLKSIWEKADIAHQGFIDKETIRKATEQKSHSVSRKFSKLTIGSIALVIMNSILLIINIWGYRGNISILLTLALFFFLCIISVIILKNSWQSLRRIDNSLLDLKRNILEKIRFYRKYLPPVLHILSYLLICLSININLIVDNDGGNFKINNPWLNILVYFIAYIGAYSYYRYKFSYYLRQLRTAINDLDSNQLTSLELAYRKQKWATIFAIFLILIIFITGIIILFMR
jgi:hypothetical protein